ncbi:MAG: PqqD family protein [Oscillospiraceae bacterium]|nr:PqqD family protein [Oscillospiraceae bacterium]MDY2677425.1 PqqD family protein [Oscillospiraceae bacterium]
MERYSVKQGYVLREIAGEYLAVPSQNGGEIVILNPVSRVLWEELQEPKTLDELTAKITEMFDVEKDEARSDISKFLENLKNSGLAVSC